ncbi:MAG TPA: hypothetical protein VF233_08270 [Nitrososphaeraceae archaeon]
MASNPLIMLRLLNQMFVEPKKQQVVMIDIAEDIAFLLRISVAITVQKRSDPLNPQFKFLSI